VEDLGLKIRAGLHTGEVLVSGMIPPLVLGSRITFIDRGDHELKGVPEPWQSSRWRLAQLNRVHKIARVASDSRFVAHCAGTLAYMPRRRD
jgi:hypothetical protein